MGKKEILKLDQKVKNLVNFLFETRILKYIPKSSLHYLRSPFQENVAEHSFYVTIIGWIWQKWKRLTKTK